MINTERIRYRDRRREQMTTPDHYQGPKARPAWGLPDRPDPRPSDPSRPRPGIDTPLREHCPFTLFERYLGLHRSEFAWGLLLGEIQARTGRTMLEVWFGDRPHLETLT